MSAIFLSTESQSPAAQMIIDCFIEIQQNMDIVSLDKYTDAISTISIIPFCVDEEFKNTFACKERKYIGWKRKEADIRLFIPFIPFVQASKEEKLSEAIARGTAYKEAGADCFYPIFLNPAKHLFGRRIT